MSLRIFPVDPASVEAALNIEIDMLAVAYAGMDGDMFAGSGGLAWGHGRCWLWFTTVDPKPSWAMAVVRMAGMMMRKARQLGETEIYTIRDPQFETSPRLLKMAGFEFFAHEKGNEVHRRVLE